MSVPTQAEALFQLIELLTQAQEKAYLMSHLTRAMGGRKDNALADGWFSIGELLKRVNHQVLQIGQGKLN